MDNKQNETKQAETVAKTAKPAVKPVTATVAKPKVVETYTVEEFAKAPASVNANSADIVRAAFKVAGKESATLSEATQIVKDFKNKEV